jgi:anti-sigma B factor antagonist
MMFRGRSERPIVGCGRGHRREKRVSVNTVAHCGRSKGWEPIALSHAEAGILMLAKPFRLESLGNIGVVELLDRAMVEAASLQELGAELRRLIAKGSHHVLIIDFANVQFLGSAALGILVSLRQEMEYQKGRIEVCGMRKELLQVLRFSQLDRLFTLHENREAALKAIEQSPVAAGT